MVTIRYVHCRTKVGNGRKQFIGIDGMFTHDYPFLFCKRSRLLQYIVGDAYLANVMEERASTNMNEMLFWYVHGSRHH